MVTGLGFVGPSLGAFETATVARGVVALDALLKRAPLAVLAARTVSPGRYLVLVHGGEAEVEEGLGAAVDGAGEDLVDQVVLYDPHPGLAAALRRAGPTPVRDALGVIETATVAAALHGADRALKELGLQLTGLRLGSGLTGKGVFIVTGPLDAVDALPDFLPSLLDRRLLRLELVRQPHPDLPAALLDAEAPVPWA